MKIFWLFKFLLTISEGLTKNSFLEPLKGPRKVKNQNGFESHFWNHFSVLWETFDDTPERTTLEPKVVPFISESVFLSVGGTIGLQVM